jgi:hypothetical protein
MFPVFPITRGFGDHGDIPPPLPGVSQIGVGFSELIPRSSQIGVDFSFFPQIGVGLSENRVAPPPPAVALGFSLRSFTSSVVEGCWAFWLGASD